MEYLSTTMNESSLTMFEKPGVDIGIKETYHGVYSGAGICSCYLSKDGICYATGDIQGNICLWDTLSGKLKRRYQLSPSVPVQSIYITPDKRMMAASGSSCVFLWNLNTGECREFFEQEANQTVQDVVLSDDGNRIFWCTGQGYIYVWDIPGKRYIHKIRAYKRPAYFFKLFHTVISLSKDGSQLAIGSKYGPLILWSMKSGEIIRKIKSNGDINNLTKKLIWNKDGTALAVLYNNQLQVWDANSCNCMDSMDINQEKANGEIYVFLYEKGFERHDIWNVSLEFNRRFLGGRLHSLHSLSMSADGRYLSVCMDCCRIWDMQKMEYVKTFHAPYGRIISSHFSEDGNYYAVCSDGGLVEVWDVKTAKRIRFFRQAGSITKICMADRGKCLFTGNTRGRMSLWSVEKGKLIRSYPQKSAVSALYYDQKSRFIYASYEDASVKLWEATTGLLVRNFQGHKDKVNSMDISPDTDYLFTGSEDSTVRMWHVGRNYCVRIYSGHQGAVTKIRLSKDGKLLISGSEDGTVKLWEVDTGKCVKTLGLHSGAVEWLFLMDGDKTVITGERNGIIRFWSIYSGELLASFFTTNEGFVWNTPADRAAPSGWLWTERPDLIYYFQYGKKGNYVHLLDSCDREAIEQMHIYNRKEMVINRLKNYKQYCEDNDEG